MQYRILIAAISLCLLGWGGINLGGGTPDAVGGPTPVFLEDFEETSGSDCATGEDFISAVTNGEAGQCDIAVTDVLCDGGLMFGECAILDGDTDSQTETMDISNGYSGTDNDVWLCATIGIQGDGGSGASRMISLRTNNGSANVCELRIQNASAGSFKGFCGGESSASGNSSFRFDDGVPFNLKIWSERDDDRCTYYFNGGSADISCDGTNVQANLGDVRMHATAVVDISFDNVQLFTTDPGTLCD